MFCGFSAYLIKLARYCDSLNTTVCEGQPTCLSYYIEIYNQKNFKWSFQGLDLNSTPLEHKLNLVTHFHQIEYGRFKLTRYHPNQVIKGKITRRSNVNIICSLIYGMKRAPHLYGM